MNPRNKKRDWEKHKEKEQGSVGTNKMKGGMKSKTREEGDYWWRDGDADM